MMTTRISLIVASLLPLAASAAVETAVISEQVLARGGARLSAQGRGFFSSARDPQDPESKPTGVLLHETLVGGEAGDLGAGVRFSNRLTTNGPRDLNTPFTLEKKTLRGELGDLRVELGDSYQELGRGIALALYRDPVLGLDTTLEGASVRYRPEGWEAGAFGGRVNPWKVPVAVQPVDSPLLGREAFLAGGQAQARLAADAVVGTHYLMTWSRKTGATVMEKRWQTVGAWAAVDGVGGAVDLYAEANLLTPENLARPDLSQARGWGAFASAAWSGGGWRARIEGKDYGRFAYDLRRPPNIEDDVVLTLNTTDVASARLFAERLFPEAKASAGGSMLAGYDRVLGVPFYHGLATAKHHALGAEWEWKGGYRWAVARNDLVHVGGKAKIPTAKAQALELEAKAILQVKNLQATPQREDRYTLGVTYSFSERWAAGLGYEGLPTNPADAGRGFTNANLAYRSGSFAAKGFVGQTGGGAQCSGGVCRQVPPYKGAMVEGTYAF